MSSMPPMAAGHTGFGSTALQLLMATTRQVEAVAAFRAQPKDFSAPRMQLASSVPAAPFAQQGQQVDVQA